VSFDVSFITAALALSCLCEVARGPHALMKRTDSDAGRELVFRLLVRTESGSAKLCSIEQTAIEFRSRMLLNIIGKGSYECPNAVSCSHCATPES